MVTRSLSTYALSRLNKKSHQAMAFFGSIISVVGKTTVEIIELFKCTQKVP